MVVKTVIIVKVKDTVASNSTAAGFTVKGLAVENGKVLLTSDKAASTNAAIIALDADKTAAGVTISKVEWTVDGTNWAESTNYDDTTYNAANDDNVRSGKLQLRVTVKAADNETSKAYIIKVGYAFIVTFDAVDANTAIFTVGEKVYNDGDKVAVETGKALTFKVTVADGKKLTTVNDGTSDLTGFSGTYTVTAVSSDLTITATTTNA